MLNFLKFTRRITILLALLLLVACTKNESETQTTSTKESTKAPTTSSETTVAPTSIIKTHNYQLFDSKGLDSRLIYHYEDDKVIKQKTENIVLYSFLGITDAKTAEEAYQAQAQQYQGLEGVAYSIQYNSDRMIEHIEVDYEKAKISEIAHIIGIPSEQASKIKFISFKESQKILETNGYTEIKDNQFQQLP
ncbi:DUF1307 domain-containing protein [Streptococcus ovuberis]|uniref:DUF1307 domain-containing protein n=1 Tax=Streptococcus ovuberis TaxID=1936207 RepID=A0A7X6MZF4_9STRE|nr:DUF1307 domain-containing protein [Streptococcus ovuberis]NKZ20618.1 DUF1307 domain-containing protein [Streptococcus ovuberis]